MGKKRKQKNNTREQQIAQELEAVANEYNLEIDRDLIADTTNKTSNQTKRGYKTTELTYESTIKPLLQPHGFHIGCCVVPGCNCKKQKFSNGGKNLQEIQCKKCKHSILNHEILLDSSSMEIGLNTTNTETKKSYYSLRMTFITLLRISIVLHESRSWRETILSEFLKYIKDTSPTNTTSLEIQPLLFKLQNILQGTYSRDELRVHSAIVLDQMYFCEYYNYIVQHNGRYSTKSSIVPNPKVYFELLHDLKPLLFTTDEIQLPDDDDNKDNNIELHEIMKLRQKESISLFIDTKIGMNGEMDQAISQSLNNNSNTIILKTNNNRKRRKKIIQQKEKQKEELGLKQVPSYDLLQLWRDNCRDWISHLYAYATPTECALDVMKEYAPLIEIGAGTGYWSSLLKLRNVDIVAYDITPPALTEDNEFHGKVPTFTNVLPGGPEILRTHPKKNLFLCYPPPLNEMAYQCLQNFTGNYILYVGEWQGNTANTKFEHELEVQFNLIKIVNLPNWSNTCYNLSIWKRKRESEDTSAGLTMLGCSTCGSTKSLKRCRLCRYRMYCSEECMKRHQGEHDLYHSRRLIYLKNGMSFHSRTMFESL